MTQRTVPVEVRWHGLHKLCGVLVPVSRVHWHVRTMAVAGVACQWPLAVRTGIDSRL